MPGFIYKLQNVLLTSANISNSDSQIARLILQNPQLAHKNVTLNELAKACYTSVSSISRFATNLGYDSFNDMKADFTGIESEYYELQIDNSFLQNHSVKEYKARIIHSFDSMNEIDLKKHATWLAEFIYEYDTIYLFATHITSNLVTILHRAVLATGKYIEFVQDKHSQMLLAEKASPSDAFIIVSLDGTLAMAQEIIIPIIISKAKRILITQNINLKFSDNFDFIIPLGTKSDNFTAKYKLMLFIDYFISVYFEYANAQKNISEHK